MSHGAIAADAVPLFENGHDGLCLSCHADAKNRLFTFVPGRSMLSFRIDASFFGVVEGRFRTIQGGFFLDPDNPERSAVAATVRAETVNTGDLLFDLVLKSESFFDPDRHPYVIFFSRNVRRTGERSGRIVGDLTLRGITRPIVLDVTFKGAAPSSGMPDRAGFVAKGTINRRDFGITFVPSGTDEHVALTIDVEGRRISKAP